MCAELWFEIIFLTHGKLIALHTENILRRNLFGMVTRSEQKKITWTNFRCTNEFANRFALSRSEIRTLHTRASRIATSMCMQFRMCAFGLAEKNGQIGKHGFLKAFYIRRNNNKLVEKGKKVANVASKELRVDGKKTKKSWVFIAAGRKFVCVQRSSIGCASDAMKNVDFICNKINTHNPNQVGN